MDHERFFAEKIAELKGEGRYRVFAELERIAEDKFALRGVHVDDVKTKAPSDEGMDHGETSNAERGQQDVMSHQGHATGESK